MDVRGAADRAITFVRRVVTVVRAENVSFMAGSLAYYAFISLVPLAALCVLGLFLIDGGPLAGRVVTLTGSTLSPVVGEMLRRLLLDGAVSGAISASVLGVATLLWGALRLFRSLNTAFGEIYLTGDESTFVSGLVDGAVVLGTVPLLLVIVILGTATLSGLTVERTPLVAPVVLVLGLAVVFLPLYYVLPDRDLSVREVLPGVFVAALGWLLLQQLFGVYVLLTGASAGSVLGAIILSLTWLYVAGVVLLVGCIVNAVHGGYRRESAGGQ